MFDKVFIIGCGDIGLRVAQLAMEKQIGVSALARSAETADKLAAAGIAAIRGDLDNDSSLQGLPTRDAVIFYFAPPPGGGISDPRMRSFCAAIPPGSEPRKMVYISTSGVYGDCGSAIVTEETPVNPQTSRARRRLDAETVLLAWGRARGVAVVILRVTGIYGPGRLPISQLASGHPVLEERLSPQTNRIHAADLARVCMAAAERGEDGEIFNVSDGQSSTMTSYFNAVADTLGFPRPRQIGMEEARRVMTPLMLSYIAESRRMDNHKMLQRLGISLLYPNLTEGLRASILPGDNPGRA
jgi:nucleoside-diphosphate-sugar epimerase